MGLVRRVETPFDFPESHFASHTESCLPCVLLSHPICTVFEKSVCLVLALLDMQNSRMCLITSRRCPLTRSNVRSVISSRLTRRSSRIVHHSHGTGHTKKTPQEISSRTLKSALKFEKGLHWTCFQKGDCDCGGMTTLTVKYFITSMFSI